MIPKILAFYLPQFHEVKENSEWYGLGFTDWVTVQNAKPLFEGHNQPRKPLNNNYYDLSNAETIKWQAELAKNYGVDGFCFYHYWFDSNTRLLEKPAELLLQHREIDISYCFSWVNESWKRTWSNVEKGNVWCDLYDNAKQRKSDKGDDRGLLAKQRYGRELEWEKHIEYLIPFFKDERYIKIDGRPLLFIYQPCDISCMNEMIAHWEKSLKTEGFSGIYLAGASYGEVYSNVVDIQYHHEPGASFVKCRKEVQRRQDEMEIFEYDTVWKYILDDVKSGKISCAFTDFDASPRKAYKGVVVRGATPQKFENYFKHFLLKNTRLENQFVLINAWNEWGESMYLEPCEKDGYGYLEALYSAVQFVRKMSNDCLQKEDKSSAFQAVNPILPKSTLQVPVLVQWLSAYRKGIRVGEFFEKYHYRTIAIYGMGILGRQLKEELDDSSIEIGYYIDQVRVPGMESLKRVSIDDELPPVDCIVVTVLMEFEEIYHTLRQETEMDIINIKEILDDLF